MSNSAEDLGMLQTTPPREFNIKPKNGGPKGEASESSDNFIYETEMVSTFLSKVLLD